MPTNVSQTVERLLRNFLWEGHSGGKLNYLIKWNMVSWMHEEELEDRSFDQEKAKYPNGLGPDLPMLFLSPEPKRSWKEAVEDFPLELAPFAAVCKIGLIWEGD